MAEPEPAQWSINYNHGLTSGEQPFYWVVSPEHLLYASGHLSAGISLTLSNATIRLFAAAI
jgi:hypothetical protein